MQHQSVRKTQHSNVAPRNNPCAKCNAVLQNACHFSQHGAVASCNGPDDVLCCSSHPPPPMGFTVSKQSDWDLRRFVKVPTQLLFCNDLQPNSQRLLIMLINQVGFKPVSIGVIDRCLNIHRSTRIRCMAELRELGFISGDDNHIVLVDPVPVLAKLKAKSDRIESECKETIGAEDTNNDQVLGNIVAVEEVQKRDYLQEAADAWNNYRPKDYQRIRRMSARLVKAIDCHMRELRVPAHNYDEFFSILKAGVEKSRFWSSDNSNKTLQSITGIGDPSDRKRGNVYTLFNEGVEAPAAATNEEERSDTVVFPASYRKVIDEYETAQHGYHQAYLARTLTPDHASYVVRTEAAIKELGLDPQRFRFKYGISTWPTDTSEPEEARVVDWTYDDEYGHAF